MDKLIDRNPEHPLVAASRRLRRALAGAAVFGCLLALQAAQAVHAEDDDIAVAVSRNGPEVTIDAEFTAPVPPRRAWEVMTDYDAMPRFLPHLHTSGIVSRNGNVLMVAQSGAVAIGPFSYAYDYVREVKLEPYSAMRSRIVSGSIRQGEVTTRLSPAGSGTHIAYHSVADPGIWIPLGISEAVIRDNIRQQLQAMRAEMLRRQGAGGG